MAFEDEARRIGSDFLHLVQGTLREKCQHFSEEYDINVPYSSYDNQWKNLVSQLGIVDVVRKILRDSIEAMPSEVAFSLRKATRAPLSDRESGLLVDPWWALVDEQTQRISPLGSFVLKYGADQFKELGRLSAVLVYHMSAYIHSLLQARPGDEVVFADGSVEKYGDYRISGHLRNLERLLGQYGFAMLEHERLRGLIDVFHKKYFKQYAPNLSEEDHKDLLRVLGKIEATVDQEIVTRNFAELRPMTGTLDYQKPPSEVLNGLLGEIAHSIPPLVRQDLEEGIKCLKFGAPTASVMINLRAVEGWLKEFHARLTGQKSKKAWGELIKGIQEALVTKNVSFDPASGFLHYLRSIRNTADHADAIFDQVAAEQTLMQATSAIRELHKVQDL